ncbi:MAG: gliding motility-associated C-terminal domain-containing protein [Saprospirales bacterium]|nr:MAG: gliding motility-associated C-terminal domain-containing protein [Saprospirales bacterium]
MLPPLEGHVSVEICQGDTYDFHGQSLTEGGTYTAEISSSEGCDSTVVLDLLVLPLPESELNVAICEGDTLHFNGISYFEAGTYHEVLSSPNSCDTLLTLNVEVLEKSYSYLYVEICNGDFYEFGGQIIFESGFYFDTLTNAVGCDSIISLEVLVMDGGSDTLNVKICEEDEFEYYGTVYDEPGVFVDTIQNAMGCDSVLFLEISVISRFRSVDEITICAGETFYWNGEYLDESGTYVESYLGAEGCDSLIRLELTVLPELMEMNKLSICEGESVDWRGMELAEPGVYKDTLVNIWGCDSVVVLDLSVHQMTEERIEEHICKGDSVWFNGQFLTETGLYLDTLSGVIGCDSIVALDLKVYPDHEEVQSVTICEGETYVFDGVEYTESGLYEHHHNTMYGCDSTEVLELVVMPITRDTIIEEICEGDYFEFYGEMYSETGNYLEVLEAEVGCDHEVLLKLEVYENNIIVDIGEDKTINLGDEVQLNAWINQIDEYIEDYYWSPPDWLSCTDCKRPVSEPLETITYWFDAVGTNGCRVRDSITIKVEEKINVFIPNAFSPNKDGINEVIFIYADKDVREIEEFKIFDRWGNKVFESYNFPPNDPYYGWDGYFKGRPMNPAVFTYYAIVELVNGRKVTLKGDITLAR